MLGLASQVSCKGTVWSISRRFNDFVDLHSSLRLKRSGADLPAKQWFGRYDAATQAPRLTNNDDCLSRFKTDDKYETDAIPASQRSFLS